VSILSNTVIILQDKVNVTTLKQPKSDLTKKKEWQNKDDCENVED